MKRIALYDVDSKIPNLALMKLAAYHKRRGDTVETYFPLMLDQYDKIYASKVFSDSDGSGLVPGAMEIGGSGWDLSVELPPEIERMAPDYSLYDYTRSIGFAMRGCRFNCSFCVVPGKEGKPQPVSTIGEIWTNRGSDFIILLDNDFFGNPEWEDRISEIQALNLKVCFSQGLNIRTITTNQARALAESRFSNISGKFKQVHFAWDRMRDEALIMKGIQTCMDVGLLPYQMAFYVLIGYDTTHDENMYRVNLLKEIGCDPFVMPIDKDDPYQKKFARWVNMRSTFHVTDWGDYK